MSKIYQISLTPVEMAIIRNALRRAADMLDDETRREKWNDLRDRIMLDAIITDDAEG